MGRGRATWGGEGRGGATWDRAGRGYMGRGGAGLHGAGIEVWTVGGNIWF